MHFPPLYAAVNFQVDGGVVKMHTLLITTQDLLSTLSGLRMGWE
jgi:hypothetical protein